MSDPFPCDLFDVNQNPTLVVLFNMGFHTDPKLNQFDWSLVQTVLCLLPSTMVRNRQQGFYTINQEAPLVSRREQKF